MALEEPTQAVDPLAEGRDALARGAWDEARAAFARALVREATPEALEGLGTAARYALDADAALAAHERGYRIARERGDADAAARLAIQLGYDAYAFRGVAEAEGWVERAAMLIEGRPPSAGSAFIPYVRGYMALLARHDPATARERAAEARGLAREVGAVDVELLATALGGLALVAEGRVPEGMASLDAAAAAAVGGEMTDADSIETVCCFLIDACKRVRDIERANEWCERVREIAVRFGDRQMFTVCRVHYADVLLWQGDLERAEAELEAAAEELGRLRPGRDVDALVRLAEVRRRQGRLADAAELLERGRGHRLAGLVEGLLALDRGDAPGAVEAAGRVLRRVGAADRFERTAALELTVRAALASGDDAGARLAAAELAAVAEGAPNGPLRAAAILAEARIAARGGDATAAAALAEDAADLLDAAGARYEGATARLELAAALRAGGHDARARAAEVRARAELAALGAHVPGSGGAGPLSPREVEVLSLLARGGSNEDIARDLVLSVRTVERHVANVYSKIGASGRTARARATAWAHAHGIA
jgi:DNA-binding CsgD family transcriptional regulator